MFTNVSLIPHGPKITRLNKIYTSRRKSPLSEVNLSPSWRNNLGHILLESMIDSPVCTAGITDLIAFNPITHVVVIFILVPKLLQKSQFKTRERTREPETIKVFQGKGKAQNWMLPQIFSDIHHLPSTSPENDDFKYSKISTLWNQWKEIIIKITCHTRLIHPNTYSLILQQVKKPPYGFCTHLFFSSEIILIFSGLSLHRTLSLLKVKLKLLKSPKKD